MAQYRDLGAIILGFLVLLALSECQTLALNEDDSFTCSQDISGEDRKTEEPRHANKSMSHLNLGRQKREINPAMLPETLICPWIEASGSDLGQKSYLIFYSPTSRADVRLDYSGTEWGSEVMKTLMDSGFDSSKPTVLASHGYHQSSQQPWLLDLRNRYQEMIDSGKDPKFNLLIYNWSAYSNERYWTAVSLVPHIGRLLGHFLVELQQTQNYNLNNVHLIGYSLSTHIVGLASRGTGSAVGQITALDPTGVCMHSSSRFARNNALRPTDAKLVVARHYNMHGYGSRRPTGGVDIFINGGLEQPVAQEVGRHKRQVNGEEMDLVVMGRKDHHRATEHEVQRIDEQCHEIAYECASDQAYLRGECADCGPDNRKCYFISNLKHFRAAAEGIELRSADGYPMGTRMYLKTAPMDPFCLHHYQLIVVLKPKTPAAIHRMLKAGAVSLDHGSENTKVVNKLNRKQRFTALVSRSTPLKKVSEVAIRVNADSRTTNIFLSAFDHLELNYMSHIDPSERQNASFNLCLNEDRTLLIRC